MARIYEIGPFRLDVQTLTLTRDGLPVSLRPRAVSVLAALIERNGEYVSKDSILAAGWKNVVVEESNVAVQISAIRRALAQVPGGEQWVETWAKRGYRFVGPVTELAKTRGGRLDTFGGSSLPQPLTSFIGRDRELAEIEQLLPSSRLLTMVGVGGIGKTRLALQVAARSIDNYPDGAWFVDLAPLTDSSRVATAVGQTLRIPEDAGAPTVDALRRYVRSRRMLLILDNCEHLLEACATLAYDLLVVAPDLRILATARESLRIAGEQIYRVAPLSLPASATDLDSVERSDAIKLFVARARLRNPEFAFTRASAAAVVEICVRLDGIPLALELAAAQLETFPVEGIVRQLDDRFRYLTSGNRVALPRQQTLAATIEWSYELLTEIERVFFARLAVFRGGWTLAAVEAVVPGENIERSDAIELLTRAVAMSLVVADERGARYRMLDTIRHFAAEKLDRRLEREELRRRHVNFYLALVEEAEGNIFGPLQGEWLSRQEDDLDNVLAAHAYCAKLPAGAEMGLRLAAATRPFWLIRGLFDVGLRMTEGALRNAGDAAAGAWKAGALIAAAQLSHYMGRNDKARDYAESGLTMARNAAHAGWQSLAYHTLSNIARTQGDPQLAHASLAASLELAEQSGNDARLASVLNGVADLQRAEGRIDAAIATYERALSISRTCGPGEIGAIVLVNLSSSLISLGAFQHAARRLAEALTIACEIGAKVAAWAALDAAAMLAGHLQQWERAARLYGAAEAQREVLSLEREPQDENAARQMLYEIERALGGDAFHRVISIGRSTVYELSLHETASWLNDSDHALRLPHS